MDETNERQATPEELAKKREQLAREAKSFRFRYVRIGIMAVVFLAVIYALTRDRREVDVLSFPKTADGERDAEYWILRDVEKRALLEVEVPRAPGMKIEETPDRAGFSAASRLGRDRDVSFLVFFSSTNDASELSLDLLSSARRWLESRRRQDARWIFYDSESDAMSVLFFEDVYPWTVQEKTGYGIPYVPIGYKRLADDGTMMRGVAFYFRTGDTRYVYRREIPDLVWARGKNRLYEDPGVLIYSNYAERYWESPGLKKLLERDRSVSELLYDVRRNLAADRAGFWLQLHREIDAVLVKSWRTDANVRDIAFGCLKELREVMRQYYWSKSNSFRNVKQLRDGAKAAAHARDDAKAVFGDPSLRYWNLVNGEEDW